MDWFTPRGFSYFSVLASRTLFNNFVLVGGSGASAGLIVAILMHVKQGPQRRIAQLSVFPSFFNFNESILYGRPLVLNSIYLLPFIAVPVLLSLMTVALAASGWLVVNAANVPWTTPPLISGWLITDSWRGALGQLLEIALSAAIYAPFVRRAEAVRKRREEAAFNKAIKTLASNGHMQVPFSRRRDEVGLISRGLLADLRADLAHSTGALSLIYQAKLWCRGRV